MKNLLKWYKRCIPIAFLLVCITIAMVIQPLTSKPAPEEEGAAYEYDAVELKVFPVEIMEHREGELVFSISIEDYVESYNGYYWKDQKSRYLLPSAEWRSQKYDTGIHSNYETIYYYFTENEQLCALPSISVYVPTDGDYIQEMTVNFDWHSYMEEMYERYEQICFYTLKVFFPTLSDEKVIALYSEVNRLGSTNVFSSDAWYSKDAVPCALFYKDGIGVFPYSAIGSWQSLCIVPVTEEMMIDFEQKGVAIYEI